MYNIIKKSNINNNLYIHTTSNKIQIDLLESVEELNIPIIQHNIQDVELFHKQHQNSN
jgi:hypothetical protein